MKDAESAEVLINRARFSSSFAHDNIGSRESAGIEA